MSPDKTQNNRSLEIPIFKNLAFISKKAILRGTTTKELKPNEYLFQQGEDPDGLYILLSGSLEVSILIKNKNAIVRKLVPGDYMGEMGLIDEAPRSASIKALEDSKLIFLSTLTFQNILTNQIVVAQHVADHLCERLNSIPDAVYPKGLKEKIQRKEVLPDLITLRAICQSIRIYEKPFLTAELQLEPKLTSLSHGGGCGCKIAPGVLSEILKNTMHMPIPENLLVGIETADDAAVYKLNDTQALIATTDFFMPIVDDPFDFGKIAATNAISDVYAMGGQPIMALAIVGMPINTISTETIGKILEGGAKICADAGIPIAGGHTIDSVEPIYGLVVMGIIHPDHVKKNNGAKAGDVLILGKPLGVGIYSAALKKNKLSPHDYQVLINATTQLNRPGQALSQKSGVNAMTDVTGFGLAGHTLELAKGADLSIKLYWDKLPLLSNAMELAKDGMITGASGRNWESYGNHIAVPEQFTTAQRALITDPQTSGGLLVSCAPHLVQEVLDIFLNQEFFEARVIGEVIEKQSQYLIIE